MRSLFRLRLRLRLITLLLSQPWQISMCGPQNGEAMCPKFIGPVVCALFEQEPYTAKLSFAVQASFQTMVIMGLNLTVIVWVYACIYMYVCVRIPIRVTGRTFSIRASTWPSRHSWPIWTYEQFGKSCTSIRIVFDNHMFFYVYFCAGEHCHLQNERAVKNTTYVSNLVSLNRFVLVKALNDTIVSPPESEHFGYYPWDDRSQVCMRVSVCWCVWLCMCVSQYIPHVIFFLDDFIITNKKKKNRYFKCDKPKDINMTGLGWRQWMLRYGASHSTSRWLTDWWFMSFDIDIYLDASFLHSFIFISATQSQPLPFMGC